MALEAFLEPNEDTSGKNNAPLCRPWRPTRIRWQPSCAAYMCGKAHVAVVMAEGACNNATALARHFVAHHNTRGFEPRVITLGYVQLSILSNHSGHPQLRISTSSYP